MSDMHAAGGDLLFHRADEAPLSDEVAGGAVVAYSMRAPLKEPGAENEDAAMWLPWADGSGLLAVADGAGGMPRADRASRDALTALRESVVAGRNTNASLREAALDGVENANRAVIELDGAATTIALVLLDGGLARVIHAGDSPVLVIDRFGEVRHQTIDHTPLGYAVEAGIFDEDEAIVHDARHIISNMLGSDEMRLEMSSPMRLEDGDTVLLASDGLFDNLYLAEIIHRVREAPLFDCAIALAATARERMMTEAPGEPSKPDDLTFLLYRYEAI